jgi:hypothetical protein
VIYLRAVERKNFEVDLLAYLDQSEQLPPASTASLNRQP